MSKIAEKKAFEAYPPHYQKLAGDGYFDMSLEKREGYIQGYDQAMQDFLEKAITYLAPITYTHPHLIDLDKFKQAIETYGRSKV